MGGEGMKPTTQTNSLNFLVDSQLAIEKVRVAVQVRNSHLARNDKKDGTTLNLQTRLESLEKFVDDIVANEIQTHPAYHWFSQVKGIGKENIAKVVGLIDIYKAPHVSSLWKWAGMHVVDGKAPKPEKGKKLEYNSQLRSMCWRLASSLKRAKGSYYNFYIEQKECEKSKLANRGYHFMEAARLPKKNEKKYEPDKIMSLGHLDSRAIRKMIKLFLSHLWIICREAEGLPTTKPYVNDVLGHNHYYDPWKFVEPSLRRKPMRRSEPISARNPRVDSEPHIVRKPGPISEPI